MAGMEDTLYDCMTRSRCGALPENQAAEATEEK